MYFRNLKLIVSDMTLAVHSEIQVFCCPPVVTVGNYDNTKAQVRHDNTCLIMCVAFYRMPLDCL